MRCRCTIYVVFLVCRENEDSSFFGALFNRIGAIFLRSSVNDWNNHGAISSIRY